MIFLKVVITLLIISRLFTRLFDGMVSALDDQGGPNMTNYLSEALIQFLLGSSSGRTIETMEGKKIDTTKLFTRPYEIKGDRSGH